MSGESDAQFRLGCTLIKAIEPESIDDGIKWLLRASAARHPQAQDVLERYLTDRQLWDPVPSPPGLEDVRQLQRTAEAGDIGAMRLMGVLHEQGWGEGGWRRRPPSYQVLVPGKTHLHDEAAHWYEMAARGGDSRAAVLLARLSMSLLAPHVDRVMLLNLILQAGDRGNEDAISLFDALLLRANGEPPSHLLDHLADYTRDAVAGNARAQHLVALWHLAQEGPPSGTPEALRWLVKAGEQGFLWSHFWVASLCLEVDEPEVFAAALGTLDALGAMGMSAAVAPTLGVVPTLQVRAWNSTVDTDNPGLSVEAAVEVAAANVYCLLLNLGLRENARAIAASRRRTLGAPHESPQSSEIDAELPARARAEMQARMVLPSVPNDEQGGILSIDTQFGRVAVEMSSALIEFAVALQVAKSRSDSIEAFRRADRRTDGWQQSHLALSKDKDSAVLPFGVRVRWPEGFSVDRVQ